MIDPNTMAQASAALDMVNNPPHYDGEQQCIYIIFEQLGPQGFRDFCRGNVIKYRFRATKKGGAEDLAKAEVYERWVRLGRPDV